MVSCYVGILSQGRDLGQAEVGYLGKWIPQLGSHVSSSVLVERLGGCCGIAKESFGNC